MGFVHDGDDLPLSAHGRRVVESGFQPGQRFGAFALRREAHDHIAVLGGCCQLLHSVLAVCDELPLHQQVFGRVAADGELGEHR